MRAQLLAVAVWSMVAACGGSQTPSPRPPVDPNKPVSCTDAGVAFARGFGAATTPAKEKGERDKAYKALLVAIADTVAATCVADGWSPAQIRCLARSTTDETLAACRELMGAQWAQLEMAADAALATFEQSYER